MEISLTDPACDPLSPHRARVPFEATLQAINSRLPLSLRTAVTMLLSSTGAIVTRLTIRPVIRYREGARAFRWIPSAMKLAQDCHCRCAQP
jgi:hypothetical protein